MFEVEVTTVGAPWVIESISFVAQKEEFSSLVTNAKEERKWVGGCELVTVLSMVGIELNFDDAGSRQITLPYHMP